jgi:hypothetical protein
VLDPSNRQRVSYVNRQRMGMAHLMGQLGLSSSSEAALPLLQRAATLATVDVPQPAYVFGLLLLGEFSHASIPPHLFTPLIPPGNTRDSEARRHLERAAYLNFAPAQYKLGHAYEFAQPPFPFDALLSVQYYSLASQQGEIEADMALSKWFLCGSEGAFDKDESLAFTFAEKAARKGLPSAEFAMGYYTEVGVGGSKDIEAARKWYTRVSNTMLVTCIYLMFGFLSCIQASQHGNTDATERLGALSQPAPAALSRQEHENLTETTLVRKRTQAKQRSDARGPIAGPRQGARPNSQQVVANVRKNSLAHRPGPNPRYPSSPGPVYNDAPEGYPAQPVSLSSSPGSSGFRTPGQPGPAPGPGGYFDRPRQQSLSSSQPQLAPPQGSNNPGPGGYPSPRLPSQRPPSQPQFGAPGQQGQGRRPMRGGSGSGNPPLPPGASGVSLSQPQPARGRTPSPPAPSDPPVRPAPAKGPATFQEMGFQSQKLEEKDCVIM